MTCACVIACDTYSVELISLFTIVIDKKYSDFSLGVKFGKGLQNNFLFELGHMLIKWYRIVQLHNNYVICTPNISAGQFKVVMSQQKQR